MVVYAGVKLKMINTDNLSFTDEQLLSLVNKSIEKYTEYSIENFTGGSVQITSTNKNKVNNYKVSLFFGYNNRNPINKSFDIQEGMVFIWMKALLVKIKTMQALNNGMDFSELNELMNIDASKVSSSSIKVESNKVVSSSISISRPRTTSVRTSYEVTFDEFWLRYPKKVGKSAAYRVWERLKLNIDDVMYALSWQIQSNQWVENNGKFIPNPATYLNQGRWMDEQPNEGVPF